MHPRRRRPKRARVGDGSHSAAQSSWRDWGSLECGPALLIADRVLSGDVADYVRFRAACKGWRRCTDDPQDDALDPRFHPRRWTMLKAVLGRGARPGYLHSRFQNVATGEHIRMTIRGLNGRGGHRFVARTSEGLLVLVNKKTHDVRVLNPITGAHVDLPPVTKLLSESDHPRDCVFPRSTAGVRIGAALTCDSAVVISVDGFPLPGLGVARPGDERWTKVKCEDPIWGRVASAAGRVYCVSGGTIMELETSQDHPPRLVKATGHNPFSKYRYYD